MAELGAKGGEVLTAGVGGTEGGSKGGTVGDGEAFDGGLEDVGDELGDAVVLRGTTGEADQGRLLAEPGGVQAHVEELAFQQGADLDFGGGVGGEVADGGGEVASRGDLGAVEGKHDAAFVAGGCFGEAGGVEIVPAQAEFIAQGFAGERAIAEADERHEATGGIAEDVAETLGIGDGMRHGGEEAGLGGAHADERRGVVAGGKGDLAMTREAVFRDEVAGDRSGD